MISSTKETTKDYNSVTLALNNETKKWETKLEQELYKMVYMQLYNRIARGSISKRIQSVIDLMDKAGIWK